MTELKHAGALEDRPRGVRLVEPTVRLREAFLDMAADYVEAGEPRIDGLFELYSHDFAQYIHRLEQDATLPRPQGPRVPANTYWLLTEEGAIAGSSRLRLMLTPALAHEGGHIGYSVRPSFRRQGYGTCILALTLEKARAHGIERVLVTCDTDNMGSARIIRKNGGVLENEVISERSGKPVSRYWITLE